MSSNYARESSGSGRQGVQPGNGTGENAASFDNYPQTMGNDHHSHGSASGNISASNMGTSGGTGTQSGIGAGHRGGNTSTVTTDINPSAGIRPPRYRGRFSGQGDISADASANDGTSYDDSGHQSQMHQHGAPQDDFIGECDQPGCATCWSTGHYDVSLDSTAADTDPAAAAGHRTIGHHTTSQHPIGHHVNTSAMGGGSSGTHTRTTDPSVDVASTIMSGNMSAQFVGQHGAGAGGIGGTEKMAGNPIGDAGMQMHGAEREARAHQAPVQN